MSETLNAVSEIIKLTSQNDTSRLLSLVGLILILVGFVAIYYLCDKKPDEISEFQKIITLIALSFGIIFSIAGPSVTLVDRLRYYKRDWKNAATLEERIGNLKNNRIVGRVMRIVVYDPVTEGDLSINRLGYLGPKDQRYTFVADYDELKGLTFTEAARHLGIIPNSSAKMSAVIFPTPKVLVPVNARGLLKVVSAIESNAKVSQPFDVRQRLSSDAWTNLVDDDGPPGYAFDNYKTFYNQFCSAVTDFRCSGNFTAKTLIGAVTKDWDALGFAHTDISRDVCTPAARLSACDVHNWEGARSRMNTDFGARVFLVQNTAIEDIPQRMLIDVVNPDMQLVPYLPEKMDVVAHDQL